MWEIYSIGDSAFLAAILNGVAMLSGSGSLTQLAGIGFVLAVFLLAFQGVMVERGPRFPYQQLLVALVVYLMAYGPTARVAIEDAYTGAVRVVDNVPIGVAAAGSVVSTLGYQVTQLFEQAFSTPQMTEEGFANSLSLLMNTYRAGFGAANTLDGGNLEKTLVNYLRDCTLPGVDIGQVRDTDIIRAPDVLTAIRFASRWFGTLTQLPGDPAIGAERDCTDAWNAIDQHIRSAGFRAAWENHLAGLYGSAPLDKMQNALNAIVGLGKDARTVMLNAVLAGLWLQGLQAKHRFDGDVAGALIAESAITQRNVQWATEQVLFVRVVRPLMTALEGLTYAVTPLMAFLIALGGMGIQLAGRYLQLAFWIQLWLPTMAIINLYLNMVATRDMAALATVQAIDPTSLAGLAAMQLQFADWLGTGGLLASSVPAVTLMLVYGSSITATSLAGRLQSGDFINEKLGAPDLMQPAPLLELKPAYTHDPSRGLYRTGSNETLLPAFNFEQQASRSLADNQRELQQATRSWLDTLGQGISRAYSESPSAFTSQSFNQALAASRSQFDQFLSSTTQSAVQTVSEQHSSLDSQRGSLAGDPAALLRGALARNNFRLDGLSATLASEYQLSQEYAQVLADEFSRQVQGQQGLDTQLQRSKQVDVEQGIRSTYEKQLRQEDQAQLQRSEADIRSKLDEVAVSRQFGTSFRGSQAVEIGAAAQRLLDRDRDGTLRTLDGLLSTYGLSEDARTLTGPYGLYNRQNLPDRDQAFTSAALALLTGLATPQQPLDAARQSQARDEALKLLAQAGLGTGAGFGPPPTTGTLAPEVEAGAARANVENTGLSDPRAAATGLPQQVEAHYQQVQGAIGQAESEVGATYRSHQNEVTAARTAAVLQQAEVTAARARERLLWAASDDRSPGQFVLDEGKGVGKRLLERINTLKDAMVDSGFAFLYHFNRARDEKADYGEAFSRGLRAMGPAADQVLQDFSAEQSRYAQSFANVTGKQATLYAWAKMVGLEHTIPGVRQLFERFVPGFDLEPARQAVRDELRDDPAAAEKLVTLLERAGRTDNDQDLRLVSDFMQNRAAVQKAQAEHQQAQAAATASRPEPPLSYSLPVLPAPPHLAAYADEAENLLNRLVMAESGGIHRQADGTLTPSPRGARGITQIMPSTGGDPGYGVTPLRNHSQEEYLRFGRDYLAAMFKEFQGDPYKALAAYNWGPDHVATVVRRYGDGWQAALPEETRHYVRKILG